MMILSGCSGNWKPVSEKTTSLEQPVQTAIGSNPTLDYEVPEVLPSSRVNQIGYGITGGKTVVFQGDKLPEHFQIIDAQTEEILYEGTLETRGYDQTLDTYISIGDFTEFKQEGTFYLKAEKIGSSYPFVIEKSPYKDVLGKAMKQYYYSRCGVSLTAEYAADNAHNACHTSLCRLLEDHQVELDVAGGWHMDEKNTRDVVRGCNAVQMLLLAYELNPEIFTDDLGIPESGDGISDLLNEVKYQIDWLLKMQEPTSGAVYQAVSDKGHKDSGINSMYVEPVSVDATTAFAATLAKFGYIYQNIDHVYATNCLQAADRAMKYLGKLDQKLSEEAYFQAAAELYRATSYATYHTIVLDYINKQETMDMENNAVFAGCVTYLSTKHKVNVESCATVMKQLMSYVEDLSYYAKNHSYLHVGEITSETLQGMLFDSARIVVANYIITNNEYERILEKYIHFFLGSNQYAYSYISELGSRIADSKEDNICIDNQVEADAYWILLLSDVTSNQVVSAAE